MDKNTLKSFAMDARKKLTERMKVILDNLHIEEELQFTQHGDLYENTEHKLQAMSTADYERYQKLKAVVARDGIKSVIEKSAYTWFNRIVAIHYMEVNNFLPLGHNFESLDIKVLCDKSGHDFRNPEIMTMSKLRETALDIDYAKLSIMNDQEKYKTIILAIVKRLGQAIPDVFDGDTENIDALIPDNLLAPNGLNDCILRLGEEQFKHTEVIGWLYQYYNQAEKDRVMDKKALSKEEIPFATQIFTPDWIVKYLVENSLGRYWLDRHPNSTLEQKWEYLVKKSGPSEIIHDGRKIEDITFIDPCSGSGHILIYAFEVFYQIYLSEGYPKAEIPQLILNNNLYGLDIDDRANQLSILSCMLVARKYDDKIFAKPIKQHILSIHESNKLNLSTFSPTGEAKDILDYIMSTFRDAKEYGSILKVRNMNYDVLREAVKNDSIATTFGLNKAIEPLIAQAEVLNRKYTIATTNPPYTNKYNSAISSFIKENYPDSKANMSAIFMEKCLNTLENDGYVAMITPDAWMYQKRYQRLRESYLQTGGVSSMMHVGYGVFEGIGQKIKPTAFVLSKNTKAIGTFIKLDEIKIQEKEKTFLDATQGKQDNLVFKCTSQTFMLFSESAMIYWASEAIKNVLKNSKTLNTYVLPIHGLVTGDNNRFLRAWWEPSYGKTCLKPKTVSEAKESDAKWFAYNKGGRYRKWYGNNDFIINWKNNGEEIKKLGKFTNLPTRPFESAVGWTGIASDDISFRYKPVGSISDGSGPSFYGKEEDLSYIQGLVNTNVMLKIAKMISPALGNEIGQIGTYPIIYSNNRKSDIVNITEECRTISKDDWNDYETSWEFENHPLFKYKTDSNKLSDAFSAYEKHCKERFNQLKANEEKLNEIAIDLYGLQDELTPEVPDKRITVRPADHSREAKSFLSYFIGCVMGRYATDKKGVQYAGEGTELPKNNTVDNDGIITIMDREAIGKDDVMNKLRNFLTDNFGFNTLSANLDWLAEGLGRKSTENSEDVIRAHFVYDFANYHNNTYTIGNAEGKRTVPIYWQISSGKHNAFKALFYIHRYNPGLMAKVRVDYVKPIMDYYDHRLEEIKTELQSASGIKYSELLDEQSDLTEKSREIREFDDILRNIANKRIELDLDDGVKRNYIKLSYAAMDVKKGAHILGDVLKDKPLKDAIKAEYGDF